MSVRLLGIGCLLLVSLALSSCDLGGLTSSGRKAPRARPGTVQLPSLDLAINDHIEGVDFAVDGDSVLHLVWAVRYGDEYGFNATRKIWYRRGDLNTGGWSEPRLLLPHAGGGPRIVSVAGRLHVIVPDSLRHLVSSDRGMTWKEDVPLLLEHSGLAQSIDVATDSGSLFVAYVARMYRNEVEASRELEFRKEEPPRSVWVTRWTEGEKTSTAWIQSIGDKEPWASTKLLFAGDGMHLFYTANELERFSKVDARVTGWLFHSSSRDQAESWASPDSSGYPGGIFEFEAAITGERYVFREGRGLVCARWQGGAWSSSYWVAPAMSSPFTNYNRVSSINAATHGDKGQLVWIDTRYQHTEPVLLNPLAWLPWAGDPGWGNNDVLVAPYSEVIRDSAVAKALRPMRLTKNLSYAEFVRARAEKDRVYVVWSGRSKVGKEITSANQPPEIFYAILK